MLRGDEVCGTKDGFEYDFKFDEEINIKENAKKLPKLKTRKVKWQESKKGKDLKIEQKRTSLNVQL